MPARTNTLEWYMIDCKQPNCNYDLLGEYNGDNPNVGNESTLLGLIPNIQFNRANYTANYYNSPSSSTWKYLPFF